MADDLKGMKVAILATDGVERIELEQPRGALYGAGASSDLLSIHSGEIQARQFDLISAGTFPVDHLVTDVSVEDYDGLKLVLNTWLAFLMEGIAESVALADTIGVDHQALRDAQQGSPVHAPVALLKLAKIDAGDESPDFSLRWATKDVDLALAEAGDQTLPAAAAIDHRWHALVEAGLGQADVSAVRQGLGEAAVKS